MSRARNLADLLDSNGDVVSGALDNVPASNDASALTTGTLPIARIADGDVTTAKLASTLDLSGKTVTLPSGTGGKVVQFVYGSITTPDSTTSSTYSTVKSLSITPTASTSKIVAVFGFSVGVGNNANDTNAAVRIYNTTQSVQIMESQWNTLNAGGYDYGGQGSAWVGIDAPASTSSQTYAFQIARYGSAGGGALSVNPYSDTQWCYLMEIAA